MFSNFSDEHPRHFQKGEPPGVYMSYSLKVLLLSIYKYSNKLFKKERKKYQVVKTLKLKFPGWVHVGRDLTKLLYWDVFAVI